MSGRKKSYAQKTAGLAAMWLPAPLQKLATTKLGALVFVVVVPLLLLTGVITINWTNGIPSVSFNQQRAAVVGKQVEAEAIKAAQRIREQNNSRRLR
jgi:hypothetical protein